MLISHAGPRTVRAAADLARDAADRARGTANRLGVRRADVVPTVITAAVQLGAASATTLAHQADPWSPWGVALMLSGPAGLLVRRRHPVPVLGVALAAAWLYWLLGYGRGPLFPSLVLALVGAVMSGHRLAAGFALAAGYTGFLWAGPLLGRGPWPPASGVAALAAWLLVLYGTGEVLRLRRTRAAELARVREADARRRVSEERLRIARELHDVVAHHISLINVQAAANLHRKQRSAEAAYAALAIIKQVSQDTLVELRALLGALRDTDQSAPRAPEPGLDRLGGLVASSAAGGVTVLTTVVGEPCEVPAAIDLAAYRIVQEALTNVTRHAGTDRAHVLVEYTDRGVTVQVDDAGRARAPVVAGTGITGMTERAAALGGTLRAAPRQGGGFRVQAWLPRGA